MQAGQLLIRRCISRLYSAAMDDSLGANIILRLTAAGDVIGSLTAAFRAILANEHVDAASKALVLSLPSASELIALTPSCDPHTLHFVCEHLTAALSRQLRPELQAVIEQADIINSTCVTLVIVW